VSAAPLAHAQELRFSNHRDIEVPDYATIRIGPFFSTLAFTQSVGYRYVQTRGRGADWLFGTRRGVIRKDGREFPLISTLEMRNYLLVTENSDLDASIRVVYEHYPLATQDDDFYVDLGEEGIVGTLSSEFLITEFLRGTLYDNIIYRTDYIDTRGIPDLYGGREYEYLRNVVGLNMDWLMAKDKNLGISLSRLDNIPFTGEFADQEYVTYSEGVSYEQIIVPNLTGGARAGFSQTAYADTNRTRLVQQDYSLFGSFDPEGGVGIRLTDATSVEVSVGYSRGHGVSGAGGTNGFTETIAEAIIGRVELITQLRKDLAHRLLYERLLARGFLSHFEIIDSYGYRLEWAGVRTAVGAQSTMSIVRPVGGNVGEYRNWVSGVNVVYHLTQFIDLNGSSTYSVRYNRVGALDEDAAVDPEADIVEEAADVGDVSPTIDEELVSDYATWVSRLGTAFGLTEKITFETYVQHTERISENENLAYERDIFEARLVFRHEF